FSGEVDAVATEGDLALVDVDAEIAVCENFRVDDVLSLRQRIDATQQRFHTRDQLANAERFGEVVVGADLESDDAIDFRRTRGEHQDRRVSLARAHTSRDLETVDGWKHDVEDEQIEVLARRQLERNCTI